MRILVITACTKFKKHEPPNQLTWDDFVSPNHLPERIRELKTFETPAAQMYKGRGHLCVMNGVKNLRHRFGQGVIDVRIISAGYGLLDEAEIIVPYNVAFRNVTTGKTLTRDELLDRYTHLQIHKDVERLILGYDLVFFLLGQDYVKALELPLNVPDTVTQIFLAPPSWQRMILDCSPNVHVVVVAWKELNTEFPGANKSSLKGAMFERLCKVARNQELQVFEEVKRNPQRIIEMVLA